MKPVTLGLLLAALALTESWAQEAFRSSLAGQAAAEARQRAAANRRFNLMWGPALFRLTSSLSTEVTDNVRYAADHEEADLSVRPAIGIDGVWPVTERNSLSLSLGLGYLKHLNATEYDGLFVTPGSDLAFDLYVGDFRFTFHDRFSFSQDVTGDPTVSGTGGIDRFENTAGVGVTWDLNKLILSGGYDHALMIPTEDLYADQRRASHLVNLSAGLALTPTRMLGVQLGGGLTDYEEARRADNRHFLAGPFLVADLSEYLSLHVAGGYVLYDFEPSLALTNSETVAAFYADVSIRHRASSSFTHSLTMSRQLQAGFFSDSLELYRVRHNANWRLFSKTSFLTNLSYEHVEERRSLGERADRYGVGFGLSRLLLERLTVTFRYQHYSRDSSDARRSYAQNRLVLDLHYSF